MTTIPAHLVSDFLEQVKKLRATPPTRIRHTLRAAVLGPESLCWHCGAPAKHVEALVNERTGGPIRMGNLVSTCAPCHVHRGDKDALEFAEASQRTLTSEQRKQRLVALSLSPQHPVPVKARRSREACFDYLKADRWSQGRVALAVEVVGNQVLIAPLSVQRSSYGGALLWTIREAGGRALGDSVWCMPGPEWKALAPALIERHAIIRLITGESATNDLRSTEVSQDWTILLEGLEDVARGRPRKRHQGFNSSAHSRAWERGGRAPPLRPKGRLA